MARDFDRASAQYLTRSSAVVTGVPFTMACWANLDNVANSQALMSLSYYEGADTTGWFHWLCARGDQSGDPIEVASWKGTFMYARTTAGYSAGAWFHACGVWSANDNRVVYINGGNSGTNTQSQIPESLNRTTIGWLNRSNIPAEYADGRIAEAAIWNVALSAQEVAILAKGVSPLLVRPESLVSYWPLIGRTSPEIDVTGGYGLTLGNAPTPAAHPRIVSSPRLWLGLGQTGTGSTTVHLTWTDNSEGEDGFSIECDDDGGGFVEIDTVAAGVETYDHTVEVGHTYTYRVRATSAALGDSEYSNEAEVTV